MDKDALRITAQRLCNARSQILKNQPFFGRLLMHLKLGFSDCETAYTDMRQVVFDPQFAQRLDNSQLEFVLIHELMHCALKHCIRGRGKCGLIYNIACDIVVNSVILQAMGKSEFIVDEAPVMHTAPDGKEGREYSAEEIYKMLMSKTGQQIAALYASASFDSHDEWEELEDDCIIEDIWNRHILKASKAAGSGSGIPAGMERLLKDISRTKKTDWRGILQQYIKYDKNDYTFDIPDKRFSGDIIMPSFEGDSEDGSIDRLWFVVDTSGSVTDDALSEALYEISDAIGQVGNMSGSISFFDCFVSEPQEFESISDVLKVKPVGGGGTSFKAIFEYMPKYFEKELPRAVIIMTDGYSTFPDKQDSLGVDVIWLIIDSNVVPPWGKVIKLYK